MMVTSGNDGYVKVWDVSSGTPAEISTRDVKQGELFTMQFCRDIPWVLATGGSRGELAIWDLSESERIEGHFKSHLTAGSYKTEDYDPANPGNKREDRGEEYDSEDDEEMDAGMADSDDSMEKKKDDKKKKSKKDKKDKKDKKKDKK